MVVRLSMLFLVIAITVALFFFRDKVAELKGYGYLGAFLISLVANATIILPMPGLLLLFGLGAAFNPVLIGLSGAAGGTIGEMTGYMAGYSGHGIVLGRRTYARAEGWMKKWGAMCIFVFALVPLFPMDIAGLLAGALRFPIWKFLLACFLGKALLYILVAYAGAWGWVIFAGSPRLTSLVSIAVLAALATVALLMLALAIENWTWKRGR